VQLVRAQNKHLARKTIFGLVDPYFGFSRCGNDRRRIWAGAAAACERTPGWRVFLAFTVSGQYPQDFMVLLATRRSANLFKVGLKLL
jgi:hypothetical protein